MTARELAHQYAYAVGTQSSRKGATPAAVVALAYAVLELAEAVREKKP